MKKNMALENKNSVKKKSKTYLLNGLCGPGHPLKAPVAHEVAKVPKHNQDAVAEVG